MPGRLPEEYTPDLFTAQEKAQMTQLIHQVKDGLMAQKGFIATPVHYCPRFTRRDAAAPEEQFGLLQYRNNPQADRRAILVSKYQGQLVVDYHIDYGVLTEAERHDPELVRQRHAQHATGLKSYPALDVLAGPLYKDLHAYLLDGYLPVDIKRT